MAIKRTIRSDFAEYSVREEGLIHVRVFSKAVIGPDEAKNHHALIEYLSEKEPHVTIVDISGLSKISPKARKFLVNTSNEWGKTIAVALISTNHLSRTIGSFFLTINRPDYPIKIFRDITEATIWGKNEYWKYGTRAAS